MSNEEQASKDVTVPILDLWVMLLSTVRYAMGRQSYMPGLTVDLIWKYKKHLSDRQFSQIVEEVEAQVRLHANIGNVFEDVADYETWRGFVAKARTPQ